jgi:hypothetical protein
VDEENGYETFSKESLAQIANCVKEANDEAS